MGWRESIEIKHGDAGPDGCPNCGPAVPVLVVNPKTPPGLNPRPAAPGAERVEAERRIWRAVIACTEAGIG